MTQQTKDELIDLLKDLCRWQDMQTRKSLAFKQYGLTYIDRETGWHFDHIEIKHPTVSKIVELVGK